MHDYTIIRSHFLFLGRDHKPLWDKASRLESHLRASNEVAWNLIVPLQSHRPHGTAGHRNAAISMSEWGLNPWSSLDK
jgi:hypothetical protein